jgi:hypothetical protein
MSSGPQAWIDRALQREQFIRELAYREGRGVWPHLEAADRARRIAYALQLEEQTGVPHCSDCFRRDHMEHEQDCKRRPLPRPDRIEKMREWLAELDRLVRGPFAASLERQRCRKWAATFRAWPKINRAGDSMRLDDFLRESHIHVRLDGSKVAVNGFYPLIGITGSIWHLHVLGDELRGSSLRSAGFTVETVTEHYNDAIRDFHREVGRV